MKSIVIEWLQRLRSGGEFWVFAEEDSRVLTAKCDRMIAKAVVGQ